MVGEPSARRYVSGFWTGTEFLIFGGHTAGSCFTVGGAYNPATDSWRRMADAAGTLTGCTRAAAVWSGTALLVWGGASSAGDTTAESGGGRYYPVAYRWTAISPIGDPTDRMSAAAVWTGTEMIVWGGARNPTAVLNDGGRYDPAADRWSAMSNVGAPAARWHPSTVWTGTELLVWGGFLNDFGASTNTGGRYDPATDSWRAMSTIGAPAARGATPAVWTGTELLVWGGPADAAFGTGYYDPLNDGGAYDPATDRWRPLAGAPLSARHSHGAVWTGRALLAWGGTTDYGLLAYDDGALYDPTTDSWTTMTDAGAPRSRRSFAYSWSGTEFLVWGGADQVGGLAVNLNDGGAYRPR
jgi:N-acetylneuraminic acid mutarotase